MVKGAAGSLKGIVGGCGVVLIGGAGDCGGGGKVVMETLVGIRSTLVVGAKAVGERQEEGKVAWFWFFRSPGGSI